MLRLRKTVPGALIPEDEKEALKKVRYTKNIANARAGENRWFYVSLASIGLCLLYTSPSPRD